MSSETMYYNSTLDEGAQARRARRGYPIADKTPRGLSNEPWASEVTVTAADGSQSTTPAYTPEEVLAVVKNTA